MAEYIEREALEGAFDAAALAFLEREDHLFDRKSVLAGMSIAAGIVHAVPASDVAPVVHGRWIGETVVSYSSCFHAELRECSHCHKVRPKDEYCSACGAKMEKEET